jgi:apolipoprotein N-acyltransferase
VLIAQAKPAQPGWVRALVASVPGAAMALAFTPWAHSIGVWCPSLLSTLALSGLLVLLHAAFKPGYGAWTAWGFGTAWVSGGTFWLYVSLHQFGGLPAWLAVVAIVSLAAALSLYMALLGAAWVRWRRGRWAHDALLFGSLWLLAEAARALILTGFPWAASGYALIDTGLVALAPWLGVYGLAQVWATGVAAVVLATCLRQGLGVALISVCVAGVGVFGMQAVWPSFVQPHGRALSVSLIQGNVPQNEKFEATFQIEALGWHTRQLLQAQGDLVMAPETVIPLLPADLPEGYWRSLVDHFQQGQTAALFGVPFGSFKGGYTNSVAGISSGTRHESGGFYRYNKHHLVPFGEFIPDGFHWFVNLMNMPLGDFTRGPSNAPSFEVAGQWVAPNICYEDLFGEDLAARFTQGPTPPPTIMANVSNLAWFGRDAAIFQHLQIARMRSLEFQRPTLRATNTGATVVIDHLGRVTAEQPRNTQGILRATVQGMRGLTPFVRWAGPHGLWPLILLSTGMVLGLIFSSCRARHPAA